MLRRIPELERAVWGERVEFRRVLFRSHRHPVDFADYIVKGQIPRGVAAALTAVRGVCPYAAKDTGDVERVSSHQKLLQHECEGLVVVVTDLAQSVDALVGVHLDEVVEIG